MSLGTQSPAESGLLMDQDALRQLIAAPLSGDHKQGNEEVVTEGTPLGFQFSLKQGGHPISQWREGQSIRVRPWWPYVRRLFHSAEGS